MGSSYDPPYHAPEDWERGIQGMVDAQLNSIRMAELITTWERIEPQRGVFDSGWIDHMFELAQQHDFRILLGTGAGNPPVWLLDNFPDMMKSD